MDTTYSPAPETKGAEAATGGAERLLLAARAAGAEICFANPGTTEMPLVAALDAVPGIRAVLGLFEGVCTGAADGYGRMTGKPALTLLHLGPGFANGIANLHNARRARTPIVNIVGDHASWHLPYDAPLTSDIHSLARPVSGMVRTIESTADIEGDTVEAFQAALKAPGSISTLVFPVDHQQHPAPPSTGAHALIASPRTFHESRVQTVAQMLQAGKHVVFLLGGGALSERGQRAASRIGENAAVRFFSETFPARTERGGGLPDIDRLPYFPEKAIEQLQAADAVVLVETITPVAYFGYEGLPSLLVDERRLMTLADVTESGEGALERLAQIVGSTGSEIGVEASRYSIPDCTLDPALVGKVLSNALPDQAIVSVEGGTCGYPFVTASASAARHTILTNTGGAIGQGLPVALGAAIACPQRRVFALQSDGSAQYTIQSLWTMARERLPIVILITSNRRYGILQTELRRAGSVAFGPQARALTELDDPAFDWPSLAAGYGVPAVRAATTRALEAALDEALAHTSGPFLIEMVLA
ncbi:MAG TPA: acetolactate synthase large subunit [Trinickia sp.]|uniref:acetolactate synthase large subunit n=1 Tax=Trinickia sp. TaxID=2571163 RepID=UPI002BCB4AFB|nr:acetolactate synthase large subunit [Trinickia sp.]HVW52009.1 acetolactate synthase large subunit [Trinickia sp.]